MNQRDHSLEKMNIQSDIVINQCNGIKYEVFKYNIIELISCRLQSVA